jgi:acetate kinase
VKSVKAGLEHVFNVLASKWSQTARDEVQAVGHRVVHGGTLASSMILDVDAKAEVKRAATFAPLHNPAQLAGIEACEDFFPGRTQVPHSKCLLAPHDKRQSFFL